MPLQASRQLRREGFVVLLHLPSRPSIAAMRVIAIDPSLRSTGFAVVERTGSKLQAIVFGAIRNTEKLLLSGCLVAIHEKTLEILAQHQPECAAFEAIIYVQSYRTAITMGSARGAAVLAVAGRGLPIYEYAPRRVKQSVVGRGAADKSQVGFMVRALLGLTETPRADAADALAIALTHFQTEQTAGRGLATLQRI